MNAPTTPSNVGADASREWQPIESAPEGVPVLTKIDDERGPRNEAVLTRKGRLWWTTNKSIHEAIYVYYAPTHWKPTPPAGETK